MSKLPPGWKLCAIGEVASVKGGGTPPSKDESNFTEEGGIPWITPADLSGYKEMYISRGRRNLTQKGFDSCSAVLLPKGAVLFSSRAPVGYVAIAANDVATNQGFKSFIFPSEFDPRYVYYYLKHIKPIAETMATGTTFKELSGSNAAKLPFLVAPPEEQKRIADKLDRLFAAVDTCKARLDAIPAILKRFRQSVLAAATSGELTEEWRAKTDLECFSQEQLRALMFDAWCEARRREFARKGKRVIGDGWTKKFQVPQMEMAGHPPGWFKCTLADLAEVIDPNPSHRMPTYVEQGMPFISSENILPDGTWSLTLGKKITEKEVFRQRSRYEVLDGAFAFSRIGTIGRSAFLPLPHEYGISHAMAVVCPFPSLIRARFLKLAMSSEMLLSQARHGVQSVGVPDLGVGKMKKFVMPLPSLAEQDEIVARAEALLALGNEVEKGLRAGYKAIEQLTDALLSKAFRGVLLPSRVERAPFENATSGLDIVLA